MKNILVVDDHSLFRDGIISLLEASGFHVVGQAGNGRDALEVIAATSPDIVLMDILMPEMDGITALGEVKKRHPQTKVVILTVSDDDENLYEAIRCGADGYLHKNLDSTQFIELLQGLGKGEAAVTRKTAARIMQGFSQKAQAPAAPTNTLTLREIDLLSMVADGESNKAIAQHLDLSENTIKYHMRNIMQKLGAQNRTEAVMAALRAGLIRSKSS